MSKTKIFCFGFGQVAESFVNKLINEKKDFDLSVTSRQETHQIEFNNIKINSYHFTDDKFDDSIKKKIEEADYILVSIPPIDGKDIVANYLDTNLKKIINSLQVVINCLNAPSSKYFRFPITILFFKLEFKIAIKSFSS